MNPPDHNLFFASRVEEGVAYLDNEESRHAMSVLRLSSDDPLQVTDGRGSVYGCSVQDRTSGTLRCEIVSTNRVPKPRCSVHMFVGLCDRDKFEGLAENLSALGAETVAPLVCRFCQKPWWNTWDKHSQRIRKKLVAGVKQSRNPWLPQLAKPIEFSGALSAADASLIVVAESGGEQFFGVADKFKTAAAVSCFVGPPGGFSPDERECLKAAGGLFVSLSANRLRTELASVVLCNAVKLALGDIA